MINKKLPFYFAFALGLALNLLSLYGHWQFDYLRPTPFSTFLTRLWFFSLVLTGLSVFIHQRWQAHTTPSTESLGRWEKIVLAVIFGLALALRLYQLDRQGLYLDERYWIVEARNILGGSVRSPFGFIGDQPSNLPAFAVVPFWLFSQNSYLAARLPGVLYSLLNLLLVFLFLKEAFGKRAAFTAASLLAVSVWDVHMSQRGWNNVNLNPFLISGTIFFLYRGLKFLSVLDVFFAAVFLGVALNLLYVAALTAVPAALYCLHQFFFRKRERRQILKLTGLFLLTTLMVISPTLAKIKKYPTLSLGRHRSFTVENTLKARQETSFTAYYLEQARQGLRDLLEAKTTNFSIPGLWSATLDPLTAIFLAVGLVWSLRFFSNPPVFLVLTNFFVMFIPIVVLYRFTSIWREYGFLPTVYILAALGVDFHLRSLERLGRFVRSRFLQPMPTLLLLLAYSSLLANLWSLYFRRQFTEGVENYESECQRITFLVNRTIPPRSLLALPDDLCASLLEATLWGKYQYAHYRGLPTLQKVLESGRDFTLLIHPLEPAAVVSELQAISAMVERVNPAYFVTRQNDQDQAGTFAVLSFEQRRP